jgi:hypothetical protein
MNNSGAIKEDGDSLIKPYFQKSAIDLIYSYVSIPIIWNGSYQDGLAPGLMRIHKLLIQDKSNIAETFFISQICLGAPLIYYNPNP